MASITTRAGKGSPLTNAEVDANFTNLNTELGQKLPLSGGTMTGAIAFAAGQTWPTFNQNTTGSAASLTTGRTIGMTGDVTWTSGSFNGTANVTGTATLANSGVTAGTYTKVTVDAKGRVTTGASLAASDIPALTLENLPDAWVKRSVRVATTANITLSGTQTIDGVAVVAGDRVLVKDQTAQAENGIYVVAAGAWSRAADANLASELGAATVGVDSGIANGGYSFDTDFKSTDTLGTTAMPWFRVMDTGLASSTSPAMSGTAAVGTSLNYARADHVHPTDTSRAATNQTFFLGTTSIAINRASAALALTGITSIDGSAATLTTGRTIAMTGDVTYTSGAFNGSANVTGTATLANSGVTAGTYTKVTVDAKGRVTTGASLASADVTTALGYTPYNSTNPNGYITSSALSSYLPLTGGSLTGPLLVSGTGGFPTDALNTAGNVPIVAKVGTNDTFFGALNQYGYQTFAINISGATNTSTTRGVIDFYTKTNGSWTAAMQLNTASARFPGAVRIGNTGTPEGSFDFIAGSDVRWLARAGRLDCVNDANTSYQSGTLRGLNLYFRTSDDVTRFSVNSDGRLYFNNGSASRGTDGYVLSVRSDSLAAPLRMGGYLEWLSDVGAIGTSYFNSDARLKKNIAPTQVAARDVIDAIEFKQFEWNEFTDLDGVRVPLGVIAQQLREVNPNFVSEMTDSTLGVRDPELLTYALKAVQELSSELKMVQQELARLKGVA